MVQKMCFRNELEIIISLVLYSLLLLEMTCTCKARVAENKEHKSQHCGKIRFSFGFLDNAMKRNVACS